MFSAGRWYLSGRPRLPFAKHVCFRLLVLQGIQHYRMFFFPVGCSEWRNWLWKDPGVGASSHFLSFVWTILMANKKFGRSSVANPLRKAGHLPLYVGFVCFLFRGLKQMEEETKHNADLRYGFPPLLCIWGFGLPAKREVLPTG